MTDYIRLDAGALEADGPAAAWHHAAALDTQAKAKQQAYRDALVARLAADHPGRGGQARVARILGTSEKTVSSALSRHKERTMIRLIESTDIPADDYIPGTIVSVHRGDGFRLDLLHDGHRVAAAATKSVWSDAEQETEDIAPWAPALAALAEADRRIKPLQRVERATRLYDSYTDQLGYTVDPTPSEVEEAGETLARYGAHADAAAARQWEAEHDPQGAYDTWRQLGHIIAGRLRREIVALQDQAAAALPDADPVRAITWYTPDTARAKHPTSAVDALLDRLAATGRHQDRLAAIRTTA